MINKTQDNMIQTFKADLYDGHLIFDNEGQKVLVDTGSPVTISRNGHFDFMGQDYNCLTSFGDNDINAISELMGYNIDVLMGMNMIEKYCLLIDYRKEVVAFSMENIPFEPRCSTPIIQGQMGEICITLMINGQKINFALDTGARISYIDQSFTTGKNKIETKNDFNPLVGQFQTPIYAMEAAIDEYTFPVNFGVLPAMLAMPLKMIGIYGAIGFDLFNSFVVLLDFKTNTLSIK